MSFMIYPRQHTSAKGGHLFDTLLEHDREMMLILARPHFKKYAMHSLLIQLYLNFDIMIGCDYRDGGPPLGTPITWRIADNWIGPTDRSHRLMVNHAAVFSVFENGIKVINNAYGIEDNDRNQVIKLGGREVTKVWKGLVSAFAKRFNSRVSRKVASVRDR